MALVFGEQDVDRVVRSLRVASYTLARDAEQLRKTYDDVRVAGGGNAESFKQVADRLNRESDKLSSIADQMESATEFEVRG